MPALPTRTQVGIVGAGPAGLVLGHLLAREGVDAVVLESRSRDYVERRVRAGVLEEATVDLLTEIGVGERLHRQGLVHHGIELRYNGRGHRTPFDELTGGRGVTIYGQQEAVNDLIAARVKSGAPLVFERCRSPCTSRRSTSTCPAGRPSTSRRSSRSTRARRSSARCWVNLLGLPAVALGDGAQLVGRRYGDRAVLAAARRATAS